MLYNSLHIDQSIVRQYIQFICNLNIVFILGITVDWIKKFFNFLFTENLENVTIKEVVVEYSLFEVGKQFLMIGKSLIEQTVTCKKN